MSERNTICSLLAKIDKRRAVRFPALRQKLSVPELQGVYVICDPKGRTVHVGRTVSGKAGLHQRLTNHLRGKSSFARAYLQGKGNRLRQGFTYRYLEVPNARARVLLEYTATAWHCPAHLGVGARKEVL